MEKIKNFTTKHRRLIYLITAAMIVIISCYFGFKGQKNWESEKYGITSDGQIGIGKNTEVIIKFKINQNNFKGIQVRLSSKTRKYTDEKLHFYLYDEDNKLVSDYIMNLKDEMYNVETMVNLPYEDSKNKNVTVYIYGEDILKIPYLYTSNNENINSLLYVNGKKQKNVLVFSALYMSKSTINYGLFVGGFLFIFILVLMFVWPYFIKKVANKNDDFDVRLKKFLLFLVNCFNKNKTVYIFVLFFVLLLGLEWFVYKEYIETTLIKQEQKQLVSEIDNDSFRLNNENFYFEQIISLDNSSFSSLDYSIHINNANKNARLHVTIKDGLNEYLYHDKYYNVNDLSDGSWHIFMNSEFTNSKDNSAIINVEMIDAGNTEVVFDVGKRKKTSVCKINGRESNVIPCIQVNYNDNSFMVKLYGILCLLLISLYVLVYYAFIIKTARIERYFIPILLLLGIIYMFVIPVYAVPDEYAHIDTSYYLSNSILGISDDEIMGRFYKRNCDEKNDMYSESKARTYIYRELYCNNGGGKVDYSLVSVKGRNSYNNGGPIYYLASSIGVTIARLFNLPNNTMLLLGRFMNLLAYVFIAYLAIKIIPIGKNLLFVVAGLSITLQEAASYSYDCIINAIAFLYIAYVISAINKNNTIKTFEIGAVLVLTFLLSSVKGGVYLPLCFIVLFIPYERKWKINTYTIVLGMFFILSYFKNNIVGIIKRLLLTQSESINGFNGGEMYTLSFLLHNPLKLLSLYINTVFVEGDNYIQGFLGGELGVFQLYAPWFTVIITILVIWELSKIRSENEYSLRFGTRFCIGLFSIVSALLVCLSMLVAFTLKEYNFIEGVQGRYFIPILLPLVILLSFRKNKKNENNTSKLCLVYCINHIIIVLSVVMTVFK